MIDNWFKKDLQKIYDAHPVAVFIDASGDAEFLLKTVKNDCTIHHADSDVEELHVKYLIEKAQPTEEKFLIYTRTKRDELKFLREYCETCGCVEIRYLENYIKEKVHQTLNLNINLPKEELIAAAKVSIGKDRTYWMDLSHKGATEIFDLKRELLTFVHDPEAYGKRKYDAQLREIFYRKVNELLDQDYLKKPASTLAAEVVKAMLDGLAVGTCNETLETVYKQWLDSVSYRNSFAGYLKTYDLPAQTDIWEVGINHPFRKIDEQWLADIGGKLSDKTAITEILPRIRQRNHSRQAQACGILFWQDVITLLEFDPQNITYLSTLSECVEFYKKNFCPLDTAIRNLYAEFLNKKKLLEPFQELYKEHVSVFLDRWFKFWNEYKQQQTGTLQRIIDEAGDSKTAVIVGDGVAYEIAKQVAAQVKSTVGSPQFSLTKGSILADYPSETQNNMSRIYMDNGVTEPVQAKREKYLTAQNPDVSIDFMRLDEVEDEAKPGQFLICTYKDIDDMGEKMQQKALKYFPEVSTFFAGKISLLLSSGYSRVYLISDHGFVLTGLLSEADKISASFGKPVKTAERYVQLEDPIQDGDQLIVKEDGDEYLCFAKSMNPFKSVGNYGFSHGGLTPQELITPYFFWERTGAATPSLSVSIMNKADLKDVTGELFTIKIQAGKGAGNLFSLDRKVYLVFFADKKKINTSDVFEIKANEQATKEYTFDGTPRMEVQLLDAETKQQLDRAEIKQNQDRDLGGLL